MEIVVRLSGVELGPYSEEQVRQHIAEGLLSLNDEARHEGTTDWAPLSEVLPEDTNPPEAIPASLADAPPESPQPSPRSSVASGPLETPRRAPATPPGVTHLPTRQPEPDAPSDSGTLGGKTMLIEPTAPIRAPSPGASGATIATTSPLGSAKQATKHVSRTALVKALSQTSPLPTKPINAPPRPPPPPPQTEDLPPPEAKKGGLSELAKALTAKTVPMRSTPPVPVSTVPIQTTEPLPTRHIFAPSTPSIPPNAPPMPEVETATLKIPPPALKGEGKPPEGTSPVQIQTTEPLPTRHIFTPSPATAPSKKEEPPAHPERKMPIPPSLDLEVATVKIPPPTLKQDQKPAAQAPAKPAPPVPEKPAAAPTEPLPPKPPRRLLPKLIAAWAILAAFMLYYVWSPYHAAKSLRDALDNGEANALDAAVDFPSVRDSLKAQINDMVAQAGLQDSKAPSGTKPPTSTVMDVLDKSVDAYVSGEGISALVNKSDATAKGDDTIPPDAAAKILMAATPLPGDSEGLASVGDFVIDRGTAILHLQFTGLGWKLKRVDLRPDLAVQPPSGSAAPIVSPVVESYLDQGRSKAKNGDGSGAIADFTQALAIDPRSSVAYNERAKVRQTNGDPDGAINDYTQALAIDPQMAVAYNGRGDAHSSKNDYDGAIADYTQAIHFDPTLATAYDGRGNAKIAKEDEAGAIADFTQAITIDPAMASAYSDRGFARQANGNPDGAIADYTQALSLKPNSARTYFNRGLALQAQGNLDAAIVDFDHALAFDPKIGDAYLHRGNAKSANHDVDGAIADYTQALTLNAKNAPAYAARGLARQAKGDLDGAMADYTQALALDPKLAAAYFNRAVIEAQKNDLDNAIADSTQALYIDPTNAQAYSTRGFAKLTKGNLDGALADLKQFVELAPRDHNADHVRLYQWLISRAQNAGADADQELTSALESSWNSALGDQVTKTASFLLGRLNETDYLAGAASPDAATDQAQRCQAWYFAGMKRLLMGDKPGAIAAFQQCVSTQQKDASEYILAQAELQALSPAGPPAPAAPPAKKP